MEILTYIGSHWVEWVFALAFAVLAYAWKTLSAKLKDEQAKNDAIAEGVKCLLRDTIVTSYNKYASKGFCPIYAKENVEDAFRAYEKLGGNHTAKSLYEKLIKLPAEKPEEGDSHEHENEQ